MKKDFFVGADISNVGYMDCALSMAFLMAVKIVTTKNPKNDMIQKLIKTLIRPS